MANGITFITDAELITGIVASHLSDHQKKDLIDYAVDMTHEERAELMELIEESNKYVARHKKKRLIAFLKLTLTLLILVGIAIGIMYRKRSK